MTEKRADRRNWDAPASAGRPEAARAPGLDVLLAEGRFYWTLIDSTADGDPNSPARRAELDEVFEREIPESFDAMAVRYTRVNSRAVIGCAIREGTVRAALEAGAIVFAPGGLPPQMIAPLDTAQRQQTLDQLNFLTGELEPEAVTRLRRARRRLVTAGVAASLLLLAGGLWYRADSERRETQWASAQTTATLTAAAPTMPREAPMKDVVVRIRQVIDQIKRSKGVDASRAIPRDAAESLATLLAIWPNDLETRVNSLQVSANQVTLSVDVPGTADAEAISAALRNVGGWSLQRPRTDVMGSMVRLTAVLKPLPPGQSSQSAEVRP